MLAGPVSVCAAPRSGEHKKLFAVSQQLRGFPLAYYRVPLPAACKQATMSQKVAAIFKPGLQTKNLILDFLLWTGLPLAIVSLLLIRKRKAQLRTSAAPETVGSTESEA
jgi:hypothetical protein